MDIRHTGLLYRVYEERSLALPPNVFRCSALYIYHRGATGSDLSTKLFVRHSKGCANGQRLELYPHAAKMVSDLSAMRSLFIDSTRAIGHCRFHLRLFCRVHWISQVIEKTMLG